MVGRLLRSRSSVRRRIVRSAVAMSVAVLLTACSTDAPGGASSSSSAAGSSSADGTSAASAPATTAAISSETASSASVAGSAGSSASGSAAVSASSSTVSASGSTGTGAAGTVEQLKLSGSALAAAKAKADGQTIGILAPLSSEYLANVVAGAKAEAAVLGFKTSVVDYQFDAAKGVAGIENLTSQGVKYIVAVLTDPPAMLSAVKAAEAQGVTVIQFAGDQVAKESSGYSVAIDDKDLGTAAGTAAAAIAKARGAVQIAILDYPSQPNVVIRADAMEAAIKAGAPQAKIVGRATGGTQEAGLTASESLLQKYPNLGGIVSVNDAGGYGAVQAFQGAGKNAGNAFVVGCDAESKARDLIRKGGIFQATVDTQPGVTGQAAVDVAGQLLSGGKVAKYTTVPVKTVTK